MNDIKEYTAEVFRRSEKRIKERKKRRNKILALALPLCVVAVALFSVFILPNSFFVDSKNSSSRNPWASTDEKTSIDGPLAGDTAPTETPKPTGSNPESAHQDNASQLGSFTFSDSFYISLTWNCFGVSSYNSETGELIKTTDASNPEDYITTYFLTNEQKQQIYDLIIDLDIETYPDKYDPHDNGLSSSPSMTLILTVKDRGSERTVAAENIALTFNADNPKGQKFLSTCEAIQNILTSTDEWRELPDPEFLYE